jgi:hypothetical protein
MTVTTVFVNRTTRTFRLKEGNNGVYTELCRLPGLEDESAEPTAANRRTLECDPKSTYKVYKAVAGHGSGLVDFKVNSDFILDHSPIYFIKDPNDPNNYKYTGDPRDTSSQHFTSNPLSAFMNIFRAFRRTS